MKHKKLNPKRRYSSFFIRTLALMLTSAAVVSAVACYGIYQYDISDMQLGSQSKMDSVLTILEKYENGEIPETALSGKLALAYASESYLDNGAILRDKQTGKIYDTRATWWSFVKVRNDDEELMADFRKAAEENSDTFPADCFTPSGDFCNFYCNSDPEMIKPFLQYKRPHHNILLESDEIYLKDDKIYLGKVDVYSDNDILINRDNAKLIDTVDLSKYIPPDSVRIERLTEGCNPEDAVGVSSRLYLIAGSKYDSPALAEAYRYLDWSNTNEPYDYDHTYQMQKMPFYITTFHPDYCDYPNSQNVRWELYTVTYYNFFQHHFYHFIGIGGTLFLLILLFSALTAKIQYQKYSKDYDINEYRRTLTGALAHDLKSPLAVISGYAENLRENVHTEKREVYADSILENTAYMNRLIEDALGLAKLEQTDDFRREQVDLIQLAKEVAAHNAEQIASQELTLQCSGQCTVSGSPQMLQQAIGNLITNAIRYTPIGGSIDISGTDKGLRICNDTTLTTENAETLMQPLAKGDTSRSGRSGSGMGLAIVRQIAALHNMKLNVETKNGKFIAELHTDKKRKRK